MHPLTCDTVELAVGDFIDGRVSDNTLQTIDKAATKPHFLQVIHNHFPQLRPEGFSSFQDDNRNVEVLRVLLWRPEKLGTPSSFSVQPIPGFFALFWRRLFCWLNPLPCALDSPTCRDALRQSYLVVAQVYGGLDHIFDPWTGSYPEIDKAPMAGSPAEDHKARLNLNAITMSVGHQLAMVEVQLQTTLGNGFDRVLRKMKTALTQAFATLKTLSADPASIGPSSQAATSSDHDHEEGPSLSPFPQNAPRDPPLDPLIENWLHVTPLADPESLQWLESPTTPPRFVLPSTNATVATASNNRPLQSFEDEDHASEDDEIHSWPSDDGAVGGSDDEALALHNEQDQTEEEDPSTLDTDLAELCLRVNLDAYGGKTRDYTGGNEDDWETIVSASGENDSERLGEGSVGRSAQNDADDAEPQPDEDHERSAHQDSSFNTPNQDGDEDEPVDPYYPATHRYKVPRSWREVHEKEAEYKDRIKRRREDNDALERPIEDVVKAIRNLQRYGPNTPHEGFPIRDALAEFRGIFNQHGFMLSQSKLAQRNGDDALFSPEWWKYLLGDKSPETFINSLLSRDVTQARGGTAYSARESLDLLLIRRDHPKWDFNMVASAHLQKYPLKGRTTRSIQNYLTKLRRTHGVTAEMLAFAMQESIPRPSSDRQDYNDKSVSEDIGSTALLERQEVPKDGVSTPSHEQESLQWRSVSVDMRASGSFQRTGLPPVPLAHRRFTFVRDGHKPSPHRQPLRVIAPEGQQSQSLSVEQLDYEKFVSYAQSAVAYQRARDKMTFEGSAVDNEVDWRAALRMATQNDNKDLLAFKVVGNSSADDDDTEEDDHDMYEDDGMNEDDDLYGS